jgi:hypothetical protein
MKLISILFCFCLFLACAPKITRNGTPNAGQEITVYGPTSADLYYIRSETIDGKMDFITTLPKDKTNFNAGEKIYSRHGMALFMWGSVVHKLGVTSEELAIKLYEEIQGRAVNEYERNAIIEGYNDYKD